MRGKKSHHFVKASVLAVTLMAAIAIIGIASAAQKVNEQTR